MVNPKGNSGVSVQALRNIWDHKIDHQREPGNNQRIQHQNESPRTQPLVLPLKSRNRKLTGTVSVDAASLSQVRRKQDPTDNSNLM